MTATFSAQGVSYSDNIPSDGSSLSVNSYSYGTYGITEANVSVFTPGDTVVAVGDSSNHTYLGVLTVNGVAHPVYTIGAGGGGVFVLGLNGGSGIFNATSFACFLRGTAITTPNGTRPVEALQIGDLVTTANGTQRPIRWIGHRSLAAPFLTNNRKAAPIRFRAGSLGDGLPLRDLLVSPEHAMFLDGVLVPAWCLVNSNNITQDHSLDQIDYFHIELDTHDILLAEGAPSESFLAEDGREQFTNANDYDALYPLEQRHQSPCAPRCTQGPRLQTILDRLSEPKAA